RCAGSGTGRAAGSTLAAIAAGAGIVGTGVERANTALAAAAALASIAAVAVGAVGTRTGSGAAVTTGASSGADTAVTTHGG
ncbi:hypothetical protein OSJ80_25395, partial [Mycobacterium ulcerans]